MKKMFLFAALLLSAPVIADAQVITVAPDSGGRYDSTIGSDLYKLNMMYALQVKVKPTLPSVNSWVSSVRVKLYVDSECVSDLDVTGQVYSENGYPRVDVSFWGPWSYYYQSNTQYSVGVIWTTWNGVSSTINSDNSGLFKLEP